MKIRISEISAMVEETDQTVSFPYQDASGEIHTIELTPVAQQALMALLLATPPVHSGTKPLRTLSPIGIQTAVTSQNRVGLKLFLTPQVAVHCVMSRELAEMLREKLSNLEYTPRPNQ